MTDNNKQTSSDTKTCFVIMPISDCEGYPAGHFREVFRDLIKPAVEDAGYICELATSTNSAHLIQLDIITKVATADLCICDLSTNNPNVLFEYGIRQAFDKPTVLIKDTRTKRIFDLSGFRDIEYDPSLRHAGLMVARKEISKAIEQTVSGSEDGKQVFSLVQMMKLTAASIPTGALSPAEAQIQILTQKIDNLASRLTEKERVGKKLYVSAGINNPRQHGLAGMPDEQPIGLGIYNNEVTVSSSNNILD